MSYTMKFYLANAVIVAACILLPLAWDLLRYGLRRHRERKVARYAAQMNGQ
jgi:hypothetical protein